MPSSKALFSKRSSLPGLPALEATFLNVYIITYTIVQEPFKITPDKTLYSVLATGTATKMESDLAQAVDAAAYKGY